MTWDCLHSEVAEMFDEISWHADDVQRALEELVAWNEEKKRERESDPFFVAARRAYMSRWAKKAKRWLRPEYRERQRIYMRKYRAQNKSKQSGDRWRRWRAANPERAKAQAREAQKRRRQRARIDPAYREKVLSWRRKAAA